MYTSICLLWQLLDCHMNVASIIITNHPQAISVYLNSSEFKWQGSPSPQHHWRLLCASERGILANIPPEHHPGDESMKRIANRRTLRGHVAWRYKTCSTRGPWRSSI